MSATRTRATSSALLLLLPSTAHAAHSSYTVYPYTVVLGVNGGNCASQGHQYISSASDCQSAVIAINSNSGMSGPYWGNSVDYYTAMWMPRGCVCACHYTAPTGYFCCYFNTATSTATVGVGSNLLYSQVRAQSPPLAQRV